MKLNDRKRISENNLKANMVLFKNYMEELLNDLSKVKALEDKHSKVDAFINLVDASKANLPIWDPEFNEANTIRVLFDADNTYYKITARDYKNLYRFAKEVRQTIEIELYSLIVIKIFGKSKPYSKEDSATMANGNPFDLYVKLNNDKTHID